MIFFTYIPVLFLSLWPLTAMADISSSSNKKGIDSYNKRNYEESVKNFTDALVERPDSPILKYNLGTALSEIGKKEESLSELSSSTKGSDNDKLISSAHFNAGNTLFRSNDFEGAINEYKEALKHDQSSKDIRHNLELAVKKLRDQQQQKKENNKEENKDDKKKDEQENQNKKPEDEKQKDKEQKNQQQQEPHKQKSEDRPMTQEEAQRLLDAINNEEEKALSLRRMKMKADMRQGDDW